MTSAAQPPRAWQRMLSGRRLDLLDPHPDDIVIEDIAHGLARVARWNGQTAGAHIFSVAQHSLLVEALRSQAGPVSRADQLAALLHDAPEYVVGDLISPLKHVLADDYRSVEARLLQAIHRRFGLLETSHDAHAALKTADRAAARLEATYLAGFAEAEATQFFGPAPADQERWRDQLSPKPAEIVQAQFLARFVILHVGHE